MNFNKCICHYLLMLFSISFFVSCTSQSNEIEKVQKMIINANKEKDFEKQQQLCDEMYSLIRDQHDCITELFLAQYYYKLCCFNGGSEKDVMMKMELYNQKYSYLGIGDVLWKSVKDIDAIWFSNIQRCEELVIRAYEDDPSGTMGLLEKDRFCSDAFRAFASLAIKHG